MANRTDVEEEESSLPLYLIILFGIFIGNVIIFGITGNILTIIAYVRDKQLRTVYNTFLVNLAVTDLLLCIVSMSFYAIFTLQTYTWNFGYYFCKAYMVIDFTICLESVLMIVIISCDRLFLVRLGPQYTIKITMKKAYLQLSISWFIAFFLYGPAIIGWDIWTGEDIVDEDDCDVQFAHNKAFTTTTAFVEFVIPFICIGTVNCIIYREIRKRNSVGYMRNIAYPLPVGYKNRPKRDMKAAKFLAAIILLFVGTWAPYTVSSVIISLCGDCVSKPLWQFLNWLLRSKAAINPVLYAYNSDRFKKNFKEIIPCIKRFGDQPHVRNNGTETALTIA